MTGQRSAIPRFEGLPNELLERFVCGEATEAERARIERAVAEDAALAAHLREREQDRRAFFAVRSFGPVRAEIERQGAARRVGPLRARWLMGLVALATAAASWLIMMPGDLDQSGLRVRGGLEAHLVVKRGERVFEHIPGQPVRAGDQLRIHVEDPIGGHVYVLGLDEHGHRSIYYGKDGGIPMAPGDLLLPDSLQVDASSLREVLYIVLLEDARAASSLMRHLAAIPPASRFPPELRVIGARVSTIMLEKATSTP